MSQSRIVGRITPRALQEADPNQHAWRSPDVHELQVTDDMADDLARITQMVDVRP